MEADFPEKVFNYPGFSIHSLTKIAFTLAHNKFYKCQPGQQYLTLMAHFLSKEGEIVTQISCDHPKEGKVAKYKTEIRDSSKKINDDEAIIINL